MSSFDAPETMPSFFLNISTNNPAAASSFFKALGFSPHPGWSDEATKTFLLPKPNDNICLMVHAPSRFGKFIRPGSAIVDAKTSTEALFSIQLRDREQVDQWLDNAIRAGGDPDPYTMKEYGKDMGMYSRSFADIDGHIWEVMTMLTGAESLECPATQAAED